MWVTRDHIVDVVKRERDQQKMSSHVSAIFYQAQITERKSAGRTACVSVRNTSVGIQC